MNYYRREIAYRLVSLLLVGVLLLGLMPENVLAASEDYPNDYTITVMDGANTVSGAKVHYSIQVDETLKETGSKTTNANGVVAITEVANHISEIEDNTKNVTITYRVNKDNFQEYSVVGAAITSKDSNTDIVLQPVPAYVSGTINSGEGKIAINGVEIGRTEIVKNTNANIKITPSVNYEIDTVKIDGIDQVISTSNEFNESITVTSDMVIEVDFIRLYTCEVQFTGAGIVLLNQAISGGTVQYQEGSTVKVTANPDENWRVSKVIKNGVEKTYTENDKVYTSDITGIDSDYNYEITFAPNTYEVSTSNPSNGKVEIDKSSVDYNGSITATITPDAGYLIDTVKVNGVNKGVVQTNDNTFKLVVPGVDEDIKISVKFKKVKTIDMSDVTFNSGDALRTVDDNSGGTIYIYANNTAVQFNTTKDGIRINGSSENGNAYQSPTLYVSSTTTISKMELFYTASGDSFPGWHEVALTKDIKIVIDNKVPNIDFTVEAPSSGGYYNNDVVVNFKTTDPDDYSGIDKVEYWITSDSFTTQGIGSSNSGDAILFNSADVSGSSSPKSSYSGSISVHAGRNNSDDVKVYIRVTDFAGNVTTEHKSLKINISEPTITVNIGGTLNSQATTGYYNSNRVATIRIDDRAGAFDEAAVLAGLEIKATDVNGNTVSIDKNSMVSSWTHSGDVHTAYITFSTEANYVWSLKYTNRAELNSNPPIVTGDSPYEFTIDKTAPTGVIKFDDYTWNSLPLSISYNLWSNSVISAQTKGEDEISPIYDVEYYKVTSDTAISSNDLEMAYNSGAFTNVPYVNDSDEKFVIYTKITDYAGNTTYVGTDGIIIDMTKSDIVLTPDAPNANGFYNSDVNVNVSVKEDVVAGIAYSGIKTIDYEVESNGDTIQKGNLYTYDATSGDIEATWNDSILVDGESNNSDNVKVTVIVYDNAGNKHEESISLAINTVKPKISVSLDGVPNKVVDANGYFNTARTATVTIEDRASTFDSDAATAGITIVSRDAYDNLIVLGTSNMISDWVSSGNKHTAQVVFDEEGNYEWYIDYTNKAGVQGNTDATTTGSGSTPDKFTVDTSMPTGTVVVDGMVWSKSLSSLTFGLYSDTTIDITASSEDGISPTTIEYYKSSSDKIMNAAELDNTTFTPFTDFSLSDEQQFVIYLKISDYAGNFIYINSDGFIIDKTPGTIKSTPESPNSNGIYNKDIDVEIEIEDKTPYSGIKQVEYWVENEGVETQRQIVYDFDYMRDSGINTNGGLLNIMDWATGAGVHITDSGQVPFKSQLESKWNGILTIDSTLNNSCNVTLFVKMTDNAGNTNIESTNFDIDVSAPEIKVIYDNNKDNNGNGYFNSTRKATIEIKERTHHFESDSATKGIKITAVGGLSQRLCKPSN
ncbi:MAG: hypothetical protein ACK5LL_16185 [Suipraeoptans sp.]